jgi:putative peptidoglycan lipid II flippase
VAQISSIVDTQLGSLLGPGAVAVLGYAQLIAVLPVSLFGVSVAAAALPELSRDAAGQASEALRRRIVEGARRVVFFVVPSAFAFATLGVPIVGLLFQTGQFRAADTRIVATVLAAYSLGLPAQASVKLLASGFYAQGDTRSPVRAAAISMFLSAGLAALLMQWYGPTGIALGASIAAYANVILHFEGLTAKLGSLVGPRTGATAGVVMGSAMVASGAGIALERVLVGQPVWIMTVTTTVAFSLTYLLSTALLGHEDARALVRRFVGSS